MKARPYFRNDDVSFDTEMEFFPQFCQIFWKHGFIQTHAITLRGLCNYKSSYHGQYCVYENHPTLSGLENDTIRALSEPYRIATNGALVEFLRAAPDEIALHGLYHTNYAAMTAQEQYTEMREGLEELERIFPAKRIRFFVPPFNKYNDDTLAAANRLGLRVLGDEGIHLEWNLRHLDLYPGIWYRYHHHRFYPGTTFSLPHVQLGMAELDASLTAAKGRYCQGRLPMPSFDYEGDIRKLQVLVRENNAQQWYVDTAQNRRERKELALAMGWIYAHREYDSHIFEVGCGSANNLLWLAQHGYEKLGGSDTDSAALAVAAAMARAEGFQWNLQKASLLEPEHIPAGTDVVLAINCVLYLPDFDLREFLDGCRQTLSPNGCIVMDQIDASFNGKPLNQIHTSQWGLPPEKRDRASEYKHRLSLAEVSAISASCGMDLLAAMPSLQAIPRVVYVFASQGLRLPARRRLPSLPIPDAFVEPAVKTIFLSGRFDWGWYRKKYVRGPEIMDPLEHYVRFGASKGYWPNGDFDSDKYRMEYMQMEDPTNPLVHAILHKNI